jgi:hypothetical protein
MKFRSPLNGHPAAFSAQLVHILADTIRGSRHVLDPFAGTGRIHEIAEMADVPVPKHGLLVVNIKDHIRGGEVQKVTDWHAGCIESVGFQQVRRLEVECPGNKNGANAHLRVPYETVLVYTKGSA